MYLIKYVLPFMLVMLTFFSCNIAPKSKKLHEPEKLKTDFLDNCVDFDFNSKIKLANEQHKPLLLCFTGYNCPNSITFNKMIRANDSICRLLEEQFIFLSLYVDDPTLLPQKEWKIDSEYEIMIKTKGQKYEMFQRDKYHVISQPYFVILDQSGNKLFDFSHDPKFEIFQDFITEGLRMFKEK